MLVLSALCLATIPARGQSGFNQFEEPRTLVLLTPSILTVADAPKTSLPIDISDFDGVGVINISCVTNTVAGTLTAAVEESTTGTNSWSAITSAAYATLTSMVSSNNFVTNLKATNTFLLPGTIVTPTAATAGFATPYLLGAEYTNTVSALSVTPNGTYQLAFNVPSKKRYLRLVLTTGGTVTNITASATFTARMRQPRYQ